MRRFFLIFIFSILFSLFLFRTTAESVHAATRYAVCDLCGYCPPTSPPTNWESCRSCIYPNASPNLSVKGTLVIDPTTNQPPTPMPGHAYTFIGCISTNLSGFTEEGAAGGVVQTLLNIIFVIVGGIALLYLIYGAFVLMTSQNNPERLNYGKRIVYGAVIGVVFCLASVFIVNIVAGSVLKLPGFGGP